MTQEQIIVDALDSLKTTPEAPVDGEYLTADEAASIVGRTITQVEAAGDEVEFQYLSGHRRRLTATLTMIPKASRPDARFLDIGCYGYMAYWAFHFLGYAHVEGVEWQPDRAQVVEERPVSFEGDSFAFAVHNFDISQEAWPLDGIYDTVILLETLEHINHDPSGVLANVTARLAPEAVFVISVPNCVSYKTLEEFMTGAPPWTYWFFHPDLRHEPRHAFEYTPIFLKALLRAAGLHETAFVTICAYRDIESLQDIFSVGAALSVEPRFFGDTMIVQTRLSPDGSVVRFPDLIYDRDGYYRSSYPLLAPRLHAAMNYFHSVWAPVSSTDSKAMTSRDNTTECEIDRLNKKIHDAEGYISKADVRNDALSKQLTEALMLCGAYADLLSKRASSQSRPLLQRLFFRTSGRPVKLVRRMLFHKNGKPRGVFNNLVLDANGQPKRAFHQWMNSEAYRALPKAVEVGASRRPAVSSAPKPRSDAGTEVFARGRVARFLFHSDGSPVQPLRMLLFRKSKQPRSIFRRLVLKKSGRPRPTFIEWLS